MITMKVKDIAVIEIFGTKFYVKHEGQGFGIYRDDPGAEHCVAYMDGWYVDPKHIEPPNDLLRSSNPIGDVNGKFQLFVYDGLGGDPNAKTVWYNDRVITSAADGEVETVEYFQYGHDRVETIIVSNYPEEE